MNSPYEFLFEIICGPACAGRSPTEAMEYAEAILDKDQCFTVMEWDERRLFRKIVAGPACAGRSIREALEYANTFIDLERQRRSREHNREMAEWERVEIIRKSRWRRIGTVLKSRPIQFLWVGGLYGCVTWLIFRDWERVFAGGAIYAAIIDFGCRSKRGETFGVWIDRRFRRGH